MLRNKQDKGERSMKEKMKKRLSWAVIVALIITLMPNPLKSVNVGAAEPAFDIGLVNFDAVLSGKDKKKENLSKMKKYIKDAYVAGDEILVFPEYALTSTKDEAVDVDTDKSVTAISTLAETYEMYILL